MELGLGKDLPKGVFLKNENKLAFVNTETGSIFPYNGRKTENIFITKGGKINIPEEEGYHMQICTPDYSVASYYKYYTILCKQIMFGTTLLGYHTKGRPKLLNKEDLLKILGIGEKTFRSFMQESKEKQIISETVLERNSYAINPYFTRNGIKMNLTDFNYWVSESNLFFSKIEPNLEEIRHLLKGSMVDVIF